MHSLSLVEDVDLNGPVSDDTELAELPVFKLIIDRPVDDHVEAVP